MAGRRVLRFAGISGILFVAGLSPGIFIGRPDIVAPSSSTQEVHRYFSEGPDLFVMGNGMAFILAAFFFLWFLGGTLRRVLRSAEGEEDGFSFVALMRGLMFITLELAGAAAEVVYPASLARYENF